MFDLLTAIFKAITADPVTGAIFAVLLLGIGGMAFFSNKLFNQNRDMYDAHNKMVKEYTTKLIDIINKTHEKDQIVTQALQDIKLVLAEMQGRLNR